MVGLNDGQWQQGPISKYGRMHRGEIANSYANVTIKGDAAYFGGLVGQNYGRIRNSFAKGDMLVNCYWICVGGLAGTNNYQIENSYSFTKVRLRGANLTHYGGLLGGQLGDQSDAKMISSYSAGRVESAKRSGGTPGGVVGYQDTDHNSAYANVYWDVDTALHNSRKGAGNIKDQPGLTGLSDAELKSALPAGFDPQIWGQNPAINHGYPYLLSNPPRD